MRALGGQVAGHKRAGGQVARQVAARADGWVAVAVDVNFASSPGLFP